MIYRSIFMASGTLITSQYKIFSVYKAVRETPWRSFLSHITYYVTKQYGKLHDIVSYLILSTTS